MPSYGGESDSGYGGWGESQGGGLNGGYSTGGWGGGLDGAPDVGTIGGTLSDQYGENSATLGGGLTADQDFSNAEVNQNPWGYDFNAAGMAAPGEWGLGELFGYDRQQGLPTSQGEWAGNENTYGFSDFASSPFGKTLRGLLGTTPFGQVANAGIDAAMGKPMSQIAANAVPGRLGALAQAGVRAADSKDAGASLGRSALGYGLGTAGGMLGNAIGGPVGGMLGARVGGMAAGGLQGGPSATTASASPGDRNGGFNFGRLAEGLGGLYSGYQGMQQAGQLRDQAAQTNQALQGQMGTLANMYSPDSPYAKQLAQQLARKDAAAGRNSQYGPRAVELQARLASMAPTVANSMSSLAGASNTGNTQAAAADRAQQVAKAQMLDKFIQAGENTGFNKWAGEGLSSLFS